MKELIITLSLMCISNLWVESEPTIMLRRLLGFKEEHYDNYSRFKQTIYRLMTCPMCSSFWIATITLICLKMSLWYIPIISIGAELINKKLKG